MMQTTAKDDDAGTKSGATRPPFARISAVLGKSSPSLSFSDSELDGSSLSNLSSGVRSSSSIVTCSSTSSNDSTLSNEAEQTQDVAEPAAIVPRGYSTYRGINYPPLVKAENLQSLSDFRARSDDVFLCTYVKSGTTWMQQILRLLANNGCADPCRTVNDDVPFLEERHSRYMESRESPRLIKTHLPQEMSPSPRASSAEAMTSGKYIYITRDPKDVAVSLYYHTRGFVSYKFDGNWDDFFEVFLAGQVDYGCWFEHVHGWCRLHRQDNVIFLTYEEMQTDLEAVVRRLVTFLGWSHVTDDVIRMTLKKSTFSHMSRDKSANYSWDDSVRRPGEVPFLRKGKSGDWVNHFSNEQVSRLNEKYRNTLLKYSDFPTTYLS